MNYKFKFLSVAFLLLAETSLIAKAQIKTQVKPALPKIAEVLPLDTTVHISKLAYGFIYFLLHNGEPKK